MARSEARIKTGIWQNQDFRDLDRTSQLVYFMALSQPTLNLCGVTIYVPQAWAHNARDLSARLIQMSVRTLVERNFVITDSGTAELWIRTLIRHDGILAKPNVIIGMSRDFCGIQSPSIKAQFVEGLGEPFPKQLQERFAKQFPDGLWKRLAEPFRQAFVERFGESRVAAHAEPPPPPLMNSSAFRSANGSTPTADPATPTGRPAVGKPPTTLAPNTIAAQADLRALATRKAEECGKCDLGWVDHGDGSGHRCECQDPL